MISECDLPKKARYLLLFSDINLEAHNVPILDLALEECCLHFHELNHIRFDFLQKD